MRHAVRCASAYCALRCTWHAVHRMNAPCTRRIVRCSALLVPVGRPVWLLSDLRRRAGQSARASRSTPALGHTWYSTLPSAAPRYEKAHDATRSYESSHWMSAMRSGTGCLPPCTCEPNVSATGLKRRSGAMLRYAMVCSVAHRPIVVVLIVATHKARHAQHKSNLQAPAT